jgi:urea transport system substrate-binding protein
VTPRRDTLDLALVVPLQGPAGLFGPSCELCAELAAIELNAAAGVLGREVRLRVVDGGRSPGQVADEVAELVADGAVDAVAGWHISAVRQWAVVGNDYVWPRQSAAAVRNGARDCGVEVVAEVFVPLGCGDFSEALGRIERCGCDGLLMLLVGEDAVRFNRVFAEAGLDGIARLSPLMDENMLLATGAASTRGLYAAAGYFEALPTPGSLDFGARFSRLFGVEAPVLNSLGESCYEGITLFAHLAGRAGSLDVAALEAVADQVSYEGPRGRVHVRDRHLQQQVYLARADGLDFDVVAAL